MPKTALFLPLLLLSFLVSSCFFEAAQKKNYAVYRNMNGEERNLYGTDKNVQGFTDDLFFEIARREGFRITFVTVPNKTLLPLLKKMKVDGVITTQIPEHREEKTYLFSDPFFSFGPVLILRENDTLKDFDALQSKVVGFGRNYGADLPTREDLGYIFRPYDQVITAIEELINGRIDAVLIDSIYGHQLESGLYAGKIKVATSLFGVTKFRLGVKMGRNDEFVTLFNKGLTELKEDGTYQTMLTYWSLFEPAT